MPTTDYASALKTMSTDPEFAKLSYTDQVGVKQQAFQSAMQNDPNFQQFNQADLQNIYAKTVFAPPALTDPNAQQQLNKLMAAVDTGDQQAQQAYNGMYLNFKTANSGSLIGRGLATIGNMGQAMENASPSAAARGEYAAPASIGTPDEHKLWEYMNVRDALGDPANPNLEAVSNVTNFGLQLADWIPIGAGVTAGAKAVIGAGAKLGIAGAEALGKAAQGASSLADIIKASPKFAAMADAATNYGMKTLVSTIAPHAIAGAVTMGTLGLPYMKMMADINQAPEADPFGSVDKFAANFGMGVAMDVGVGLLTRNILPALMNTLKFTFKGIPGTEPKFQSPEELQQAVSDFQTGNAVAQPLTAIQSDYQQARLNYGNNLARIAETHPSALTDEDRLLLGTSVSTPDLIVDPKADGSYNIFNIKSTDTLTELKMDRAPSLPDAYDTVSQVIGDRTQLARTIDPATQQYVPWVFKWQDSATGPSAAVDRILPEAATPGKILLVDRPYIGTNELDHLNNNQDANGQVVAVPIRMELGDRNISRLQSGQQAFTYDDLVKPQTINPENANAVMLSREVLDMPLEQFNQGGNTLAIRARMNGYDTLRLTNPDNTTAALVPLAPNNIKMMAGNVDHATGKIVDTNAMAAPAIDSNNLRANVTYNINKELPFTGISDNPKLLSQFAVQKFGQRLDPQDVKLFVQSAMGRNDIPINVRQAAFADTVDRNNPLQFKYDPQSGIDIYIPNGLSNKASTLRFTDNLVSQLGMLRREGALQAPGLGPNKIANFMKNVGEDHPFFKALESQDANQQIATEQWMQKIMQNEFQSNLIKNPDGTYKVQIGDNIYNGNLSDIYKSVRPGLVPPAAIKQAAAEMGISIRQDAQGNIMAADPQGKIQQFKSYSDVANQFGIDTNVLPAKYRPTFVELSPDGKSISIQSDMNTVQMGHKDALNFLNSFRSSDEIKSIELIRKPGGMAALVETPDVIQFKDSATNTKLNFATMDEARAFAKFEYDSWNGSKDIANSKGLSLDYNKGAFEIRSGDGTVQRFNNIGDARAYMANFPTKNFDAAEMIPGAKEIMSMLPKDMVAQWKSFRTNLQPAPIDALSEFTNFHPDMTASTTQAIKNATATFQAARGKLTRDTKIEPTLNNSIDRLIAGSSAKNADLYNWKKIIGGIFSGKTEGTGENAQWVPDVNGKIMSADRREAIYYNMSAQSAEELAAAQKNFPLRPGEKQVIDQLQRLMGERTPTGTTGAFARFNIPYDQFTYNYLPRLRDAMKTDKAVADGLIKSTTPGEFFDTLDKNGFDKMTTQPMRKSFEFSRKSDLQSAIMDTDALSCAVRYGEMGFQKLHMDIPNQEYAQIYNKLDSLGKIPPETATLLKQWHSIITGAQKDTVGEQVIASLGQGVMKNFGNLMAKIGDTSFGKGLGINSENFRDPAFAAQGAKLLQNFMSTMQLTYLAAKPMTAFRFALQTYNMFGPMFGMENTMEAVRWMNEASTEQLAPIVQRLIQSDVLTGTHVRFDIAGQSNILNGVTEKGMYWIKNADDLIRVLGYKSAYSRFIDACQKLGNGTFGTDATAAKQNFVNYSKLSIFQKDMPQLIDRIWSTVRDPNNAINLKNGNSDTLTAGSVPLDNAAHDFAQSAINLTLHNYNTWNKPLAFGNGVVGKLAGQLGSYSACYRNFLTQAATNLGPQQFAGFMATFVASNLAIFSMMKAANIKSNDFLPFLPGIIGIGPSAQAITEGIGALRSGTPQTIEHVVQNISPIVWRQNTIDTPYGQMKTGTSSYQANYPALLPGSAQAYYMGKAINYAKQGGINGWYRAMISLTAASIDGDALSLHPNDLTLPLGPLHLAIPGGNPSAALQTLQQKAQQRFAPALPNLNPPFQQ